MDIGFPSYTKNIHNKDNRKNTGRVSFVGLEEKKGNNIKAIIKHGDEYIANMLKYNFIQFIKIDVEGFELQVMNGLVKSIKSSKPIIQMEVNPVTMQISNTNIRDIFDFAKIIKYSCYWLKKTKLVLVDIKSPMPLGVNEIILCHKSSKTEREIYFD